MKIFSGFSILLLSLALSPEASHANQLRAPAQDNDAQANAAQVIVEVCENFASAYVDLANTINSLPQGKTFGPDPDFQMRTLLIQKKRIVRESIKNLECHAYTSLNLDENTVKSKEAEIPMCSQIPDFENSLRMHKEGRCKGIPQM